MAGDKGQEAGNFSQGGQPADRADNVLPTGGARKQGDVFLAAVQLTRMAMALSDPNQPDNPLVFVNPSFTDQTGYSQEEAIGRNCRFLQGPATDPATIRQVREAVAARESITVEIYNYRRDGRGFWNARYISPIFDTDGKLVHFFSSQVDVSALKDASLRQQQHLDAIGSLASGVAHSFNNLATVALASIGQAARSAVEDSQRVQLARADAATRAAGRLTQQMLSFSRRQFLQEETVDLNNVVLEMDELLQQVLTNGTSLRFDLAPEPLPVRLDPGQLKLALVALVQNAADATEMHHHITVRTREHVAFAMAQGRSGRPFVELSVRDNGPGMAPEISRRSAEPFFTTKPSGVGLGLSMVQGFAEQSDGRFSLETMPGQGTTIRIAFPRHG